MNVYYLHGAKAYASVGLDSAAVAGGPHELVALLFDGAIIATARARAHMESGDIEAKGQSVSKAIQIVDEGLKASLNLEAGGELAAQLWQLYEYIGRRLLLASLRNEPEGLAEVHKLLSDLKDAWGQIEPARARAAGGA